jgi:hypothetical protein
MIMALRFSGKSGTILNCTSSLLLEGLCKGRAESLVSVIRLLDTDEGRLPKNLMGIQDRSPDYELSFIGPSVSGDEAVEV